MKVTAMHFLPTTLATFSAPGSRQLRTFVAAPGRAPALLLTIIFSLICHVLAQPLNDPIPARIAKGDMEIELVPVVRGLASPVWLLPAPDTSERLFVVDQAGQIRVVEKEALAPQPFLDVTDRLVKLNKDFDERGLLGLAFDPHFNDRESAGYRRLFTYTSEPKTDRSDFRNPYGKDAFDHQSVVASWRVASDATSR
jgi:hypothetical protein